MKAPLEKSLFYPGTWTEELLLYFWFLRNGRAGSPCLCRRRAAVVNTCRGQALGPIEFLGLLLSGSTLHGSQLYFSY